MQQLKAPPLLALWKLHDIQILRYVRLFRWDWMILGIVKDNRNSVRIKNRQNETIQNVEVRAYIHNNKSILEKHFEPIRNIKQFNWLNY